MSSAELYVPVPVSAAQDLAEMFAKDVVVIVAYDRLHKRTHLTTFGREATDKVLAVTARHVCAEALGQDLGQEAVVHEDFRRDFDPALYKESLDILRTIYRRHDGSPVMVQRVERFLKSVGEGVRRA